MTKFLIVKDSAGNDILLNPDLICYAYPSDEGTVVAVLPNTDGAKDGSHKPARKVIKVPFAKLAAALGAITVE